MKKLKSIALLTVIILTSWTASSQTSSERDSLKCFTYEQAREIAKAIKHGEICDSIAQNQELQIINFREIVGKDQEQINLMKGQEKKIQDELDKTKLRLKINKKITSYGIPGAAAVGILVGFLIAK
jgi:hypothetical protein